MKSVHYFSSALAETGMCLQILKPSNTKFREIRPAVLKLLSLHTYTLCE